MSTQSNHQGSSDLIFWILTIVLFCAGLWPISVILLIYKFVFANRKKSTTRARHPYDIQREWEKAARQAGQSAKQTADGAADRIWNTAEQVVNRAEDELRCQGEKAAKATKSCTKTAPPRKKPSSNHAKSKIPRGTALIVWGTIISGIFALSTIASSLTYIESMLYGYFFSDELIGVLTCALFLAGGLAMLGSGLKRRRQGKRFLKYLGLIGSRSVVPVSALAKAAGISRGRVLDDLQDMLDKGVLTTGYLDFSRDLLVLSADGIPDEEPAAEPEPAEPDQDDNAILAQIRAVNDAIPDPVMSEKIDRIETITGKILEYQRSNPGKDSQLRSFLNYYLPTTLKILNSYAQLDAQGVEGENITAAKQRIEGMMDKVVEGFEKQLDKLFADSAMDISSDVAVLEQMLEKDGLSSQSQGMTLGG